MEYWYITGTGSGLGKAIAETALHETTRFVYGISRHATIQHKNYHHTIADFTDTIILQQFSFTQHPDADKLILINNAGMLGEVKHCGDMSDKNINWFYNGHIYVGRYFMRILIKR